MQGQMESISVTDRTVSDTWRASYAMVKCDGQDSKKRRKKKKKIYGEPAISWSSVIDRTVSDTWRASYAMVEYDRQDIIRCMDSQLCHGRV